MDIKIENDQLRVKIRPEGAELRSVVAVDSNLEYMWSGDPNFWGKTSPVLFPVVGTLKNGAYQFAGNKYHLSRHGFARDVVFNVGSVGDGSAIFSFQSTPKTLAHFPFQFKLTIKYDLDQNVLKVTYLVENKGDKTMYFSLGAHPAFKVPLVDATRYEDYYLKFNQEEDAKRWPINSDGLLKRAPVSFLQNIDRLSLTRDLFSDDALVFKQLRSTKISLKSSLHDHGLDFGFEGFPFLGLWAARNADFVCIEPWCGVADSEDHDQVLETKEGIETLDANRSWTRAWEVLFY
jgi:galactose mutarotase-like enzyme